MPKDIASFAPIQTARRGCLGMCGNGPNCLLEQPGKRQAVSRLDSFSKVISLVKKVLKDTSSLTPDLLEKARVKSDAIRIIAMSVLRPERTAEDMGKAIALLSGAIDQELAQPSKVMPARLRSLYLLRGKALGRRLLAESDQKARASNASAAVKDFEAVLDVDPNFADAYAEIGHINGFVGQTAAALQLYQKALSLMHLGSPEASKLQRRVQMLQEGRIASLEGREDSGDGSGLWKVLEIEGLSPDTCIYRLQTLPPAEPHPFPHSAWHVNVAYGANLREYTPVSSASAWESGRLDLLVKTYPNGTVSRFFGSLQTAEEGQEACLKNYGLLEEQNCWVRVSAPMLTLELPCLGLGRPVEQLAIVAGGTGIAPAIQILSEVVGSEGSMGGCSARLLYSSRTPRDVLMLDELRALSVKSHRVQVAHTLTQESRRSLARHFRGKHRHFTTSYVPRDGPLQAEEVAFHRRVDTDMLKACVPGPGQAHSVIVCGPQGLLDVCERSLKILGHGPNNILLLRATATESLADEDFSEESDEGQSDDEVSQDELADMPVISVSPVPEITISAPSTATSKPGDLLKAQLAGGSPSPSPGLTFADRVLQAQKRSATAKQHTVYYASRDVPSLPRVFKGWSTFVVLKSLDSVLKNIGEARATLCGSRQTCTDVFDQAVAILVIYVFDVLVADYVRCSRV